MFKYPYWKCLESWDITTKHNPESSHVSILTPVPSNISSSDQLNRNLNLFWLYTDTRETATLFFYEAYHSHQQFLVTCHNSLSAVKKKKKKGSNSLI